MLNNSCSSEAFNILNWFGWGSAWTGGTQPEPSRKVRTLMAKLKIPVPKGFRLIFRAWKTDKNGNRLYAKDYGLKGWPLLVPVGK